METLEIELLQQVIDEQSLIITAALVVLGILLKKAPKIADWLIPWLLIILGIGFALLIYGTHANAVLQGIIAAGMAVFCHQLYKQTKTSLQQKAEDAPVNVAGDEQASDSETDN